MTLFKYVYLVYLLIDRQSNVLSWVFVCLCDFILHR
ncbi:unnamed protein product [Commensalibacter papalotli (ex Botero et al. 2024)]|uniref:Uncharacterized protein n=1 Tax=Commensalibacter papalotli (ex Botero et al. 2024) TaxID=2972766 RepID=A0ABM9HV02_9PROT|nr:unnamed protein product [Commensalibacter papalotli (ex Botero et al. 2024)]CAI3958149.1 unnamed protein product [Commensalibacter papalotli (ex Botero et al. 2024)]